MKQPSPTLEGFRAIFRVPSLGLAEIAWRWSFAVAGGALLIFAAFQFLDTLPVTSGDLALLRTRQPALISRAALHIFHGSAPRAIAAAIVTLLFIAIAWIVVASLGRAAGIKVLLDYFRAVRNSSQASSTSLPSAQGWRLGSVMGLTFLRVAITLVGALRARSVLFRVLVVALLYFSVVDFLRVGRLAAYVHIALGPDASLRVVAPESSGGPQSAARNDTQVDQDEPILSDLPLTPIQSEN